MLKVGIDIGGTKIAGGVVDEEGHIVEKLRVETPIDTAALEDAVVDMVRHLDRGHEIAAVGVAAAGFVDRDRRHGHPCPEHRLAQRAAQGELSSRASTMPVTIENDANAAGWAEFRFGAGRDVEDMVMLTMGTGVGGAVISGGALYRGGHGIAGELGHIALHPRRAARAAADRTDASSSMRRDARCSARPTRSPTTAGSVTALAAVRAEKGSISGPAVSRLVLAGDPGALEALRRVATALGEACGGFQAVLDPELFVIGGGVAQLGEDPARTRSASRTRRRCPATAIGRSRNSRSPTSATMPESSAPQTSRGNG